MRIGFLVDATCDLPDGFFAPDHLMVMPISAHIGDLELVDCRDTQGTLEFLKSDEVMTAYGSDTAALTESQFRDLFLQRLVVEYDYVFCLTMTKTLSPIYERATRASYGILNDYHAIRQAVGKNTPFSLRVLDTCNLFSGQGIPAFAGLKFMQSGVQPPRIRAELEHIITHTHTYVVVTDLHYLRKRGKVKGDRSVGMIGATLGSALDIKPILHCNMSKTAPVAKVRGFEAAVEKMFQETANEVARGLLVPALSVSYGGPLEHLRRFPGYENLAIACHSNGIELLESVMSLSGIINLGAGAVSLGFATDRKPALS